MPRVLFALFVFLLVGEARGQGADYEVLNFRGLKVAELVVSPLDQDSKDCGLKQEPLEAAVMLPINAYTKLRFEPGSSFKSAAPLISISVVTMKNETGCYFAYSLEVKSYMMVKISDEVGSRLQTVMLWRSGGVAGTGSTNGQYITGIFEARAKALAIAWQQANPN